MTGAVRASLALYNTAADIDALASALTSIAQGERADHYVRHASGDYQPAGWCPEYDSASSWLAGAV